MIRVYISGPITGMPDRNRAAFAEAEALLRKVGHEPVNPILLPPDVPEELATWEDFLRKDIRELTHCQGVALICGYARSPGSLLEVHVAERIGLEVKLLEDWL